MIDSPLIQSINDFISNRNRVDPLLFRMYYGCGLRLTVSAT